MNKTFPGLPFDTKLHSALSTIDIQRQLNKQGATLKEDGIWGPKTESAAKGKTFTKQMFWDYIDVPYLSQRDNKNNPNGTCNVTCAAMILASRGIGIKRGSKQLEDVLFAMLQSNEAQEHARKHYSWAPLDTLYHVHGMLAFTMKKFDIDYEPASLTLEKLLNDLIMAPVIISTKFTKSGHLVVACGCTKDNDLIINDPYGDFNTGYKDDDGYLCLIPHDVVKERILRDGKINGIRASRP